MDLTPEQLQQLTELGLLDDQEAQLNHRLTRVQAAQSAPQRQYTDGIAAAIGGVGSLIGGYRARQQEQDVMGQLQGLQQKRQSGRALAMSLANQPLPTGPETGTSAPYYVQKPAEGDPRDEMGQPAPNPQPLPTPGSVLPGALAQRRQLAQTFAMTGDPVVSRLGQTMYQSADREEARADTEKQHALDRAIRQENLQREEKRDAQYESYRRDQLAQLGGYHDATLAQGEKKLKARAAGAGPGAGASVTPETVDMLAQQFVDTGKMASLGMGRDSAALRAKVLTRAAELSSGGNLATNAASFKANQASLGKLQIQADAMNSFEATALANLDQFLGAAKGVVDTGSPLFNMPARQFKAKVLGDPNMTAFNVSREVAVQEISKVLSGSVGGTAVSDSARHEAAALLSPDASLAQIFKAADILKKDMHNRKSAVDAQLAEIAARIHPGGAKKAAAAAPTDDAKAVEWAKKRLAKDPNDADALAIKAHNPGAW